MGGGVYLLTTTTRLSNIVWSMYMPKKPKPTPAWVARTTAPAKLIVPKVTVLNKLTSRRASGKASSQRSMSGSNGANSKRSSRRTSAAGRTCLRLSGRIPKSSCVSSCWQGRRHRAARGVHQVRSRHVLSSLRRMQGLVFVGAEAQVAESTICVVSCVPHRHACVARACELGLSAR